MTEVLVVGQGLAGLSAAALAASNRGCAVTVIALGRGGLSLSHGCIAVWDSPEPMKAVADLPKAHPYSLSGTVCLRLGTERILQLLETSGVDYEGSFAGNLRLPTALGSVCAAAFAPKSLARGDLENGAPFKVAGLEGFRDFYPEMIASNLAHLGVPAEEALLLPMISAPRNRDAYSTDLAALFDDKSWLEETSRAWKPRIGAAKRLALPAVVGLARASQAMELLQTRLGISVFEIPTLPPSIPGLRLERALRMTCQAAGVSFVEGAAAVGLVDGKSGGKRVAGVVARTAGGPREIISDVVILATGGILSGGLVARADGRVQESVFDLPVIHTPARSSWTDASPWCPQPYSRFGVCVDARMQPVGRDGHPMFENLYAIGGLLADADRTHEGSRQGIDIATAHRATEVIFA